MSRHPRYGFPQPGQRSDHCSVRLRVPQLFNLPTQNAISCSTAGSQRPAAAASAQTGARRAWRGWRSGRPFAQSALLEGAAIAEEPQLLEEQVEALHLRGQLQVVEGSQPIEGGQQVLHAPQVTMPDLLGGGQQGPVFHP
jgi:hypothetical protein